MVASGVNRAKGTVTSRRGSGKSKRAQITLPLSRDAAPVQAAVLNSSEALKLQRHFADADHIAVLHHFTRDGVRAVVQKSSIGGVQVSDRKLEIFVAQAGVLWGNRGIAQHNISVGCRSDDIRPFANAEIFALMWTGQSHEPSHNWRFSLVG